MMELSFNNIVKYLGSTQVFKGISFQIYDRERVGIVGANGSGKSTILKIIAGIEELTRDDKGTIAIPRGATIAYLEQIPNYNEGVTVKEVLNQAFGELHSIESNIKALEERMKLIEGDELERALKEYSRLQQEYEVKDGYEQDEKLSKVCQGLNLTENFINKEFNILSGGEKTTVILGKILLQNPDILLLDEPTNHLDMQSVEWLEGYLKGYKGIVIVVSHDRYFLDNVVTKIIELEDMYCEIYKGNYSYYVNQKEENMLIQFENYKEQQKKIAAMEKAIKDLRDWAIRADNNKFFKRAASMQKSLNKMDRISKPKFQRQNMKLSFNEAERSGNDVIVVKDLYKNYGDKELFRDGNMQVNFGERVALIGANGSGKTTFLKMVLGEEQLDGGSTKIGESVKVAYLPQNITFDNEEATVLETFRENFSILEGKAREYLSKFMFYGGNVFKKVKHLSGGERIRLKLSQLLFQDINLLIMDEPTNHLDIDSIENLEEALKEFNGTIFYISHDRYFINNISNRLIAIEDKKFTSYEGNYDNYKEEKIKIESLIVKEEKVKVEKVKKTKVVDEKKKLEKEVEKLEEKIDYLEEKVKNIEKLMVENALDYNKLNELQLEKDHVEKELDETISLWEEKSIV
ncbi:ribosomal protection-like ABC-F family protein [Clostridium sp. UBA1056]|uniref:ribosomal protection-like ABC-F family protein n=1 Tax=unclassified Clostridium TaxID=2614128 RepID=UPI003216DF70